MDTCGLDLVFLFVDYSSPIGVQFARLSLRIAGTHRIHLEYVIHPIASSGSPLPWFIASSHSGYMHTVCGSYCSYSLHTKASKRQARNAVRDDFIFVVRPSPS